MNIYTKGVLFVFLLLQVASFNSQAQVLTLTEIKQECKIGSHAKAIEALKIALKASHSDWELWNQLGNCEEHQGNINEAITAYEKAHKLNMGVFDINMSLSKLYYQKGNKKESLRFLDQAVTSSPNEEEKSRTLVRVILLLEEEKYYTEEALKYLQMYKEMGRKIPYKMVPFEANTYYTLGKYEMALKICEEYLNKLPSNIINDPEKSAAFEQMFFIHAQSCIMLKRYAEASKYYGNVTNDSLKAQLYAIGHEYLYKLGYVYFFTYDYSQARQYLEAALELKIDYNSARIFLNQIDSRRADRTYAISATKHKIGLSESQLSDAKYYADLARLFLHEQKFIQAVRSADSCLVITSQDSETMFVKGVAEYLQKNNDEAVEIFEKLQQICSDSTDEEKSKYYFMLALAYRRVGDKRYKDYFNKANYGYYAFASQLELQKKH